MSSAPRRCPARCPWARTTPGSAPTASTPSSSAALPSLLREGARPRSREPTSHRQALAAPLTPPAALQGEPAELAVPHPPQRHPRAVPPGVLPRGEPDGQLPGGRRDPQPAALAAVAGARRRPWRRLCAGALHRLRRRERGDEGGAGHPRLHRLRLHGGQLPGQRRRGPAARPAGGGAPHTTEFGRLEVAPGGDLRAPAGHALLGGPGRGPGPGLCLGGFRRPLCAARPRAHRRQRAGGAQGLPDPGGLVRGPGLCLHRAAQAGGRGLCR